ncbi:MAG: YgjV family protein [Clostridia bacterium]|nr:YgjV family protein [Clostridia bacterium]
MSFYVASQIVGYIALSISLYAFWQHSRKKLLKFHMFASFLYGVHYNLMGAFTGGVSSFVGILRAYIFSLKENNKKYQSIFILVGFWLVYLIILILTYQSWFDVLAIASTLIFTFSLWVSNVSNMKLLAILGSIIWLAYTILIKSYPGMMIEILFATSTAISYIKTKK